MKSNFVLFNLIFLSFFSIADDYREPLRREEIKTILHPSSDNQSSISSSACETEVTSHNLGQGYYETTDTMTEWNGIDKDSYCVVMEQPQSSGNFSQVSNYNEFMNKLGIKSELKASLFGSNVEAASNFEKKIVSTKKSLNFIYEATILSNLSAKAKQGVIRLSKEASDKLKDAIKAKKEQSNNEPMRKFEESYGTSFITTEEIGIKIYVMLTLNFNTNYESESFKSSLGGYHNLQEVMATLENNNKQRSKVGNIKIDYFQLGGTPEKLAGIFNKNKEKLDACLNMNFNNCTVLFNNINIYIANKLEDQLKDGKNYFRFGVKDNVDYSKIAYNDGQEIPSFMSNPETEELIKIKEDISEHVERVEWDRNTLIDVIPAIDKADVQLLSTLHNYQKQIDEIFARHFQAYGYSLKSCFVSGASKEDILNCKNAYNKMIEMWKTFSYKNGHPRLDRDLATLSWSVTEYWWDTVPYAYGEPRGKPFVNHGRLTQKMHYYYINKDGTLNDGYTNANVVVYENVDIDKTISPFIYGRGTVLHNSSHYPDWMKYKHDLFSTAQGEHTETDLGNRTYYSDGKKVAIFKFLPSIPKWDPKWVAISIQEGGIVHNPGVCLSEPSGKFQLNSTLLANNEVGLYFQSDAHLVAYRADGQIIWASHTNGWGVKWTFFEAGNLIISDYKNEIKGWTSDTHDYSGKSVLCLLPDGLIIKNGSGRLLWVNGYKYVEHF